MNQLRDYQLDMLQRLNKAWKRNCSVMVQMPTGTGKTHLMAAVIKNEELRMKNEVLDLWSHATEGTQEFSSVQRSKNSSEGQVLVVAHRRELIAQISQTLDGFGVEHGLIVSGKEIDFGQKVQVASIQTLARRGLPLASFPPTRLPVAFPKGEGKDRKILSGTDRNNNYDNFCPSLVIIDEAHHALADTYRMLWDRWPNAKFLGLTATPCRLNNAPFTDLFQVLLQSYSIQEFIDKGWLSDFEYVSAAPNSTVMRQVRTLNKRGADGDYQQKELATVMDVPESIEHLYKTYKQFADGKKGIVYAIDRQHAQHIAEYYKAQGVACTVIDAKTPANERQQTVNDYRQQTINVLINVDVFSEGFDCPEVEFIQLARPTLSLSKYLQQVGRGMRVSPGKPHVLILDNVGLYQTFGLPTEERDWRQTFYGLASGKGVTDSSRMVVLDGEHQEKELVNLQMVRIKKGGKRHVGLEIFLKDGMYGVRNNGKVSCPARFKEIVRLDNIDGYFAAGIYGYKEYGNYLEMASLIDRKGIDRHLRLYREVSLRNGIFYSRYKPKGWGEESGCYERYWDPKGDCYYDWDPEFEKAAGVEIGVAEDHSRDRIRCFKFRVTTGKLSPRFYWSDVFYNDHIIIASDYLVVKRDKNHAYHICGYWNDTVIVQNDDMAGYLQIMLDGRKGERFRSLPDKLQRISPISYIYYLRDLKMQTLRKNPPRFAD